MSPRVLTQSELDAYMRDFGAVLAKPNKKAIQLDSDREATLHRHQLGALLTLQLSRDPTAEEVCSLEAATEETPDHRITCHEYIAAIAGLLLPCHRRAVSGRQ